jgi:hypothetical protein
MDKISQSQTKLSKAEELLEMAWVIIANANDGNWDRAATSWVKAAEKWRDDYHNILKIGANNATQEVSR